MARGTLDYLRQQILLRLERSGRSQADLAKAVGHSPSWLSMILTGKRALQIAEIDRIAQFLEAPPSALFEDPDLDPALLLKPAEGAKKSAEGAKNAPPSIPRAASYYEARLRNQREIIARYIHTIERQQRAIDAVAALLQPAVEALEQVAPIDTPHRADRHGATGRGADRSRRDRSAGAGRR
jgi:transcriptional regulator with XRE-family HTH domain